MERKIKKERRNFNEEKKAQVVEMYEESGQTQIEFCRRKGLAPSNLRRWIARRGGKREEGKKKANGFVEVEAAEQAEEKAGHYRIGNPSGIWVEFSSGFDGQEIQILASILREIERC